MPSLTKKLIRGRTYYYLRECQRVDGKPKIVWQQYLGFAADLAQRLAGPTPQQAVVREFGASAACVDMARQLDVAALIDRHVPKRDARGPSVDQYLLIAALVVVLGCGWDRIAYGEAWRFRLPVLQPSGPRSDRISVGVMASTFLKPPQSTNVTPVTPSDSNSVLQASLERDTVVHAVTVRFRSQPPGHIRTAVVMFGRNRAAMS